MEVKSKQEDRQSKLAKDMHNFHHGCGNGVNAYCGNNHRNGNFTPKRYNGVSNFYSYAKSFEHISYDDYGGYGRVNNTFDNYEHSPYNCYENECLCVQNFEDSSKDEEGKLAYKSIKTISFFPSNSYMSIEIYVKEIKLFSLVFMENRYQFYFLNSLGTLIEKKQFVEFNSISCAIPRVNECHFNIANYVSYMLGIEDKGRNTEKKLCNFLKDLHINDTSIVDPNIVGLKLKCALIDVLHDESIGKYVEQLEYVLPILGVFMRIINGFILFIQHVIFLSKQIASVSENGQLVKSGPMSMVGPAPIVASRFLDGIIFEGRTLPRPVGCNLPLPVGFGNEMAFVIFWRDFIV
ncbi:hypothetical protein M9H77_17035 [Catharanthus roseus]|uniref:Uncharacterized protein n=1 Tax=Catharanthus roseus TaxID=4058 RepID=A0ACC0B3G1_CATRO|nr:hypothetical protein M9H77_17035 [Catharanthus roseus]